MISRVVNRAFEAWDPAFGMVAVMSAGAVVSVVRIVFDLRRGTLLPPLKRAVEFRCNDMLYYAEVERFEENTSP